MGLLLLFGGAGGAAPASSLPAIMQYIQRQSETMEYLRQSTAVTVKMGPFLDDGDGKTPEVALTISQADIRLSKNGGAYGATNNAAGATHDENGEYGVPLDTTDTNTAGRLKVVVVESGALPVWKVFTVLAANVYDAIVLGSDALQVHANEITNNLITAAAVADGAIDAATFAAGAINAAAIATNAVDADALATDAITEIVTAMLTTQMTEAYAADTVAPTLAQILFMIWSLSAEKAIVTTTVTAKKLDGATTSMTFTLNDQSNPTSITRAT